MTVLVVLESAQTTDVALGAANASRIANAIRFMTPTDQNALTGDSFLRVSCGASGNERPREASGMVCGYYRTRLWLLSAATPPERSTRGNAWVETAFQSER